MPGCPALLYYLRHYLGMCDYKVTRPFRFYVHIVLCQLESKVSSSEVHGTLLNPGKVFFPMSLKERSYQMENEDLGSYSLQSFCCSVYNQDQDQNCWRNPVCSRRVAMADNSARDITHPETPVRRRHHRKPVDINSCSLFQRVQYHCCLLLHHAHTYINIKSTLGFCLKDVNFPIC